MSAPPPAEFDGLEEVLDDPNLSVIDSELAVDPVDRNVDRSCLWSICCTFLPAVSCLCFIPWWFTSEHEKRKYEWYDADPYIQEHTSKSRERVLRTEARAEALRLKLEKEDEKFEKDNPFLTFSISIVCGGGFFVLSFLPLVICLYNWKKQNVISWLFFGIALLLLLRTGYNWMDYFRLKERYGEIHRLNLERYMDDVPGEP